MEYQKLKQIVEERANCLKESAAHQGAWNDGGCSALLERLNKYEHKLVVKMDLRPSEYNKLKTVEVGEPSEFSSEIEKYKIQLAKSIHL
jgi:hypothetical protein